MMTKSLASLAVLTTCSAVALGAPSDSDSANRQLQIYPKNLARQHVGTNLFIFNPTSQSYAATEAAAAWLDDDVTTGWPIMAGKQHYLLSLAEPQLLTNFSLSTRPATGTVTIYASDEPAPPGAKAWTPVAKDVPLESINQKKLAKPFSRFAKYLLIETNITDPGPVYSVYVYSDRPAVAYQIQKREQSIDTKGVFGPHTNAQTSFSTAGLYSMGRVTHANSGDGYVAWQKAVDDNPESSLVLAPSTKESGMVVKFDSARSVSRLAVLSDGAPKGKLEFFIVPEAPGAAASAAQPAPLDGLSPTATVALDGTTARSSLDFPASEGSAMLVRWTPDNGTDPIALREVAAFSDYSLADYELTPTPEAIAELGGDPTAAGNDFKDFKGDFKEPIKEILPFAQSPYLPGALGFPPNLTGRPGPASPF